MEAEDRRKAAASVPQEVRKPANDPSLKRASGGASLPARDDVASPSVEAGQDPAPTRHEPETEEEQVLEKSKYESSQTFRPPRGNRFS